MYALGIDLGTTYTAAATWRDGRAEIASLGGRGAAIPSVVLLRADETFLTGEAANRRGLTEPSRVAREFKRRLGDTTPLMLGGTPYSAEALMAQLLRAVVAEVSSREGGPPTAVCVSHPANWGPYKIDLLRQAVRMADLPSVSFVTEPEAAAVNYAQESRLGIGAAVAVYDLGGGTFDAAVLRRTGSGFTILGQPEGIERLGGIDFDAAVFNHVRVTLGSKLDSLDDDDPSAITAVARLREECVAAKEALSSDTDTSIPVLLPNVTTEVRLTRAELESMIRPALHGSIEALQRAVRSAELTPEQLHAVLLVGGSSRMPLVGQLVAAELGRPVAVDTHPKHAVALGAARLAGGGFSAPPRGGPPAAGLAAAGLAGGPGGGSTDRLDGSVGQSTGSGAPAGTGPGRGFGPAAGQAGDFGGMARGAAGPTAAGLAGGAPAAGSPAGRPYNPPASTPPRGEPIPHRDGLASQHRDSAPLRGEPMPPRGESTPPHGGLASPHRESGPLHRDSTPLRGEATPPRGEFRSSESPARSAGAGPAGGAGTRPRYDHGAAGPGGSRSNMARQAEVGPPPESGKRRRLLVVVAGVVALVLVAGVGVGLAVFGGDKDEATQPPAQTTDSSLPTDERCTDAIMNNPRWVCLTAAIVAEGKITIDYRSGGGPFSINGGYHLHVYGGDGSAPADSVMGMQAPAAEQGKWYVEDRHPAVLALTDERFTSAIGDAPKVCARIADANHFLVPDAGGTFVTGNCVPITRTAETTTVTDVPTTHGKRPTHTTTSESTTTTTDSSSVPTTTTTPEIIAPTGSDAP